MEGGGGCCCSGVASLLPLDKGCPVQFMNSSLLLQPPTVPRAFSFQPLDYHFEAQHRQLSLTLGEVAGPGTLLAAAEEKLPTLCLLDVRAFLAKHAYKPHKEFVLLLILRI